MDGSRGRIVNIAPGNPAAGADWETAIPAGKRWRLLSVLGVLTASAAVANRNVAIRFRDIIGGNVLYRSAALQNQVAGTVVTYSWAPAVAHASDVLAGRFITAPMPLYELQATAQGAPAIGSITQAIDVADQWSNIRLVVEEWDV